ncbi:MAG: ribosomal protein S18-alanine N-acetyltransferase [Clostridia bacterium]|nr:ribosomal protein S18-alanine N-acetyltransferase [Clostridia bacterium]
MPDFVIEKMTEKHIPQVAELEKICFSEPWSENSLREEIENQDAYFIVAAGDDEVLGYAGMHLSFGDGFIDNIAVFPNHRGRKIGEKLTAALIEKAGENGEFITLEVRESNTPAIRLYEKLGFAEVGRRKNFYTDPRESAIIYTLNFNK